ncbi:zinc-dependent metalloprotease [Sphingorhabdus sp.]|uniref:zinc-dependent metalloprotease n=1 Tax=Sphingorhabdus sp. TaxID=1902408 RepID=UPI00391B7946
MIKRVILASLLTAVGPALPAYGQSTLVPVTAGQEDGKIILTMPRQNADGIAGRFLYVAQIETGIGSSATGVDRGAPLRNGIIRFRRAGAKVIAELENTTFVATSGSAAQKASVANSFTNATLWVGDITSTEKDGSFKFDFAPFLAMDHFGFAQGLGEGYSLLANRSVADPAKVRMFPDNVEFSALLSFTANRPPPELRNVSPTGADISLWVRHSLVRLPVIPMPVRHDPYDYIINVPQYDFSVPLGRSMLRKVALRHRLEKTDPNAARSRVKKPIVYYVDSAAPPAIRQALLDGVGWWAEAFDAAGYIDAFRVEELPADVDPLDMRYNVVNWVNRATRGWAYGSSIIDPRTGEILKGSVMLDSLRAQQDVLIFQALVGAGLSDSGDPSDPVAAALARIRQLGAHEVGHTLGFQHNFASSTQSRYSVMDYPAPRVTLTNGKIDLSDAYGVGIGEWDKFTTRYLYAETDEAARLMAQDAQAKGFRFVSDNDARPISTGNPEGALWDDYADPVAELGRVMKVREAALARFNVDAIPAGQDLASLRRAFVPIWMLHRFQIEAAAKTLGGVTSPSALAGDAVQVTNASASAQIAVLDALLSALSVEALTVPARLQPILSYAQGDDGDYATQIEIMPTAGGPVFDSLRATEIGAVHVLDSLLDPQRLNRLEMQHASTSAIPSPVDVIGRLISQADSVASTGAVGRRIATTIALDLARTAREKGLARSIAMQLNGKLLAWSKRLASSRGSDAEAEWRRGLGALLSDQTALAAAVNDRTLLPTVPPGMPIG